MLDVVSVCYFIDNIQSTPLNRVTSGPGCFDPIKRRNRLTGVPIKRSILYIILVDRLFLSRFFLDLNSITIDGRDFWTIYRFLA